MGQSRLLRALTRANSTSTGRGYSPVLSHESDEVKVRVKVGLNGYVPLRYSHGYLFVVSVILTKLSSIRHPPKPSNNGPIILFLPRGFPEILTLENTTPLALTSNATVVRLDYRLSDQYPYPTPIHDVLAGYDWVQKHLARSTEISHGLHQTVTHKKLGICGELVGGSLASILALTECHVGKPGISGAALGNPIVDWTSMFPNTEDAEPHPTTASEDSLYPKLPSIQSMVSVKGIANNPAKADPNVSVSMESLISLRSTLFSKPETYFDPFISPLLFFRTPGHDLPPDPSAYIGLGLNASDDDPQLNDPSLPPVKKRRSHRRYPPATANLRLPKLRVEVGKDNALRAQGLELVELARRSVGLWEEGGKNSFWDEDGTTKLENGVGKERVEVVEREDLGLWGERAMAEIGQWFGEVLRRS